MDVCGGIQADCKSRWGYRSRVWRRLIALWTTLVLAGGTLTAPGVRCQTAAESSGFTFRPGDQGFNCSFVCYGEGCATNRGCDSRNSTLQLIPEDDYNPNSVYGMAARYMREQPVRLWNVSFWTFFVLQVSRRNDSDSPIIGDGITFLIAPSTIVPTGSGGGSLGLFVNGSDVDTGAPADGKDSKIVAVAFDTFQSVNASEPPAPYVGLLVNSMRASASQSLNSTRLAVDFVGNSFGVWVEYDARSNQVEVSMLHVPVERGQAFPAGAARDLRAEAVSMFVSSLNVTARVAELSYVGFSAATGYRMEMHEIFYWQFQIGESTALLSSGDGHEAGRGSGAAVVAVAVTVSSVGLLAAVAVLLWCCWRKRRCRWPWAGGKSGGKVNMANLTTLRANTSARKFSYDELRMATHDFAEKSVLGEGGFGKVFKGRLKDGTAVAVKRISDGSKQGEKEFIAEVTIIGRLRHKNLVSLLGWCQNTSESKDEFMLVYGYMPNGSLDRHVLRRQFKKDKLASSTTTSTGPYDRSGPFTSSADEQECPVLSWDARYLVLQGVATALLYLHEDCQEGGADLKQAVVHRDIKSSNVMLDADWNGRLGDFGLARVIENKSAQTASTVVGTRGYVAPEYVRTGKVSVKTDVYSFGVLVLEVVTGRPPFDWRQPEHKQVLVDWIRSLHHANDRLESAADPGLRGAFNTEQVVLLVQLGLLCTADDPEDRPSMRQIVQSLPSTTKPLLFPSTNAPFSNPSLDRRWSLKLSRNEEESQELKFLASPPTTTSTSSLY